MIPAPNVAKYGKKIPAVNSQNGLAAVLRYIFWLIGQKTCYKTAITIKISMVIAVLSFLKEDKGWTKNVFRMHGND